MSKFQWIMLVVIIWDAIFLGVDLTLHSWVAAAFVGSSLLFCASVFVVFSIQKRP